MHKKKSQRIYTSLHSAGLELTQLTCTRLEDNLIHHWGDRLFMYMVTLKYSIIYNYFKYTSKYNVSCEFDKFKSKYIHFDIYIPKFD